MVKARRNFIGSTSAGLPMGNPTTGVFNELPAELHGLIDLTDPDLDIICESIGMMRAAGFDVTTPDGLEAAISAGRRRAGELAAAVARRGEPGHLYAEAVAERVAALEDISDVYYARLGPLCKIGRTTRLRQRMSNLGVEELLVTEPGGPALERRRHSQFADLWSHGEWFRYEGDLAVHVESLQVGWINPLGARRHVRPA